MAAVTLSDKQVLEVLTDLARGQSPAQVATRRHLAETVVEGLRDTYGPGTAELNAEGRRIAKRMRTAAEPDDYADVPAPPAFAAGPAPEPEPEPKAYDDAADRLQQMGLAIPTELRLAAAEESPRDGDEFIRLTPELHATVRAVQHPDSEESTELPPAQSQGGEVASSDGSSDAVEEPASSFCSPAKEDCIDRLLNEALQLPGAPADTALGIISDLDRLRELITLWHANRRSVLLRELEELTARKARIVAELAGLPGLPLKYFDHSNDEVSDDQVPVDEPHKSEFPFNSAEVRRAALAAERASAVWFQLPRPTKVLIRTWAEDEGLPFSRAGRQPNATVEAYLAAHPEHDPRVAPGGDRDE